MSIEETEKINKLAAELYRQGIASTRDDAVRRAQEMLIRQSGTSGTQSVVQEQEPKSKSITDNYPNEVALRDKQFVERELSRFSKVLDSLSKEIFSLKDELGAVKSSLSTIRVQMSQASQQASQQKPAQQQLQKEEQKPQQPVNHPRSGSYKSEEVAIDKFFYFGSRK